MTCELEGAICRVLDTGLAGGFTRTAAVRRRSYWTVPLAFKEFLTAVTCAIRDEKFSKVSD